MIPQSYHSSDPRYGMSSLWGSLLSECGCSRGGRYFWGPKTKINIDGLPDNRMVESVDVEKIEFFSDSEARKAKLSALSP